MGRVRHPQASLNGSVRSNTEQSLLYYLCVVCKLYHKVQIISTSENKLLPKQISDAAIDPMIRPPKNQFKPMDC